MNYKIILFLVLLFAGSVFAVNISTCQGLQDMNLSLSGTYVLTQNIDCSATSTWNGGLGFRPIGTNTSNFTGSFNGAGFKITGLFINRPGTNFVGLFGYTSSASTIQNVTLENVNITGGGSTGGVGALVGYARGSIQNITISGGSVTGTAKTGGMIGDYSYSSSLTGLRVELTSIYGLNYTGGIIGYGYRSVSPFDLNDSSAQIGTITARGDYAGGIIGSGSSVSGYMYINRCSSIITGKIDSNATLVGGILGKATSGSRINDSNADVNYIFVSGGEVTGVGGLVADLDGNITNSFAIVDLIDFNKNVSASHAKIGGLVGFLGSSSGNGFITNCWANASINASLGNYTSDYIGGLAGIAYGGIINSYARGNFITANKTDRDYIGGLAGRVQGYLLDSNAVFSDINGGSGTYVGGLVGSVSQTSAATMGGYIYSKNLFATTNTITGGNNTGGLVGSFVGYSPTTFDLNDSYATIGNLYLSGTTGGGLFGTAAGYNNVLLKINNCYATITGKMQAVGSIIQKIGGLLGGSPDSVKTNIFNSYADINYIYAYADYSSDYHIGGLVGYTYGSVVNSHASVDNIDAGQITSRIGGLGGTIYDPVLNSWADANINNSIGTNGATEIAGLVGLSQNDVNNSYSKGNFIIANKSGSSHVGGLVGWSNSGKINNSYSSIQTITGGTNTNFGGLIGLSSSAIIRHSFSITSVTAGSDVNQLCSSGCTSTNVISTYYLSGSNVMRYPATLYSAGGGTTYFKGTSSVAPFGDNNWSFYNANTNPSGVWYVWGSDYPHLSEAPILIFPGSDVNISDAINLGSVKRFIEFDFNVTKPSGTDINFQIRTATSEVGLASAPWLGPDGTQNSFYDVNGQDINSVHDLNSWVQWRANRSTDNNLIFPTIESVTIITTDVTFYASGTFISKAINLGGAKKFTTIDLNMNKPNDTNIQIQLRTSTTQLGLTSAPWLGPNGNSDTYYSINGEDINSVHDGNSWVQYKAILTSLVNTKTPSLYDVNIHTLATGEAIYSKTGTQFGWLSFTPSIDANGCFVEWFYSLSNSPYNWISTSGELSGNQNLWIKVLIKGTNDSNNLRIGDFDLSYFE